MNISTKPAPFNMFDMDRNDGQYLLSWYGALMAFGFHGSPKFVELTENLIINHGLTRGTIHKANEQIFYIITSKDKLEAALLGFFESAIRITNEVESKRVENGDEVDFLWDDAKVKHLALERVAYFMENCVRKDNFMLDLSQGAA